MKDYNHVTLVGNLARDPEAKKCGEHTKTSFVVAVSRDMKRNGKTECDFIHVNAWGKLGEVCNDYLKKGKKVLVDGKLQISSYESDNEKKWFTEIIADNIRFLSAKEVS